MDNRIKQLEIIKRVIYLILFFFAPSWYLMDNYITYEQQLLGVSLFMTGLFASYLTFYKDGEYLYKLARYL
jgi:hypothetical protein